MIYLPGKLAGATLLDSAASGRPRTARAYSNEYAYILDIQGANKVVASYGETPRFYGLPLRCLSTVLGM